MWSKSKRIIISDIKTIAGNHRLSFAIVILLISVIFLVFYFPVISHFIFQRYDLRLDKYYPLISITLIGVIPVLIGTRYGMLFCTDQGNELWTQSIEITAEGRNLLFMRVLSTVLVSFLIVVLSVLLVKPVPSQGWLRTLYIAIMLSIQSTYSCVIFIRTEEQKNSRFAFSCLTWILLIAMPAGLLLHHPWNYFAFLSPYYWIAWSWMIGSPTESFVYGFIALLLTSIFLTILLRQSPGKIHL